MFTEKNAQLANVSGMILECGVVPPHSKNMPKRSLLRGAPTTKPPGLQPEERE